MFLGENDAFLKFGIPFVWKIEWSDKLVEELKEVVNKYGLSVERYYEHHPDSIVAFGHDERYELTNSDGLPIASINTSVDIYTWLPTFGAGPVIHETIIKIRKDDSRGEELLKDLGKFLLGYDPFGLRGKLNGLLNGLL